MTMDIIGVPLAEALEILKRAGITAPAICLSCAPRGMSPRGTLRVTRTDIESRPADTILAAPDGEARTDETSSPARGTLRVTRARAGGRKLIVSYFYDSIIDGESEIEQI